MPELQPYFVYIAAAAAILVVMLLLAAIFRGLRKPSRGAKGERLGINEYLEVDETRRLVLVRRDNVEHLIMIGGPQDVVIESRIGATVPQSKHPLDEAVAAAVMHTEDVVPFRAAPRAPIFGGRRPNLRAVDDKPEGDGPDSA